MKIEINAKNLELTASLEQFISEKLGGLDKFVGKFEDMGEVPLRVTIERATAHHHKGEVFRASADMILPKKNLHAEETHEDAHSAIDAVKHKLQSEIDKYKDEH